MSNGRRNDTQAAGFTFIVETEDAGASAVAFEIDAKEPDWSVVEYRAKHLDAYDIRRFKAMRWDGRHVANHDRNGTRHDSVSEQEIVIGPARAVSVRELFVLSVRWTCRSSDVLT